MRPFLTMSFIALFASPVAAIGETAEACIGLRGHLIERKAEAGDQDAQYYLHRILSDESCSQQEQQEALNWLERAATSGHPEAAFQLGIRYVTGFDVVEDLVRGLALMETAAIAGHREAQFQYAMIMLGSASSREHREIGLYWLGAAASQGDTKAALTLGHIYAGGLHGVSKETCWATDWFDAAFSLAEEAEIEITHLVPSDIECNV